MDFVKLVKGKLIDAQPGFVDSWNRMVDCWNNLTGAGKASVRWPIETVPTVDVPEGSDNGGGEDEDEDEENLDDIPELVMPPFDPCRPSSGREYIKGDDTNIVFTPVEDTESEDYGKIKVDVYYL